MIINDLDGYYIVFDTKNWNTELDTLINLEVAPNLPKIPILQDMTFKPCPIENIPDEKLQSFLSNMYDREEI